MKKKYLTVKANANNASQISALNATLAKHGITVLSSTVLANEKRVAYTDGFFDLLSGLLVFELANSPEIAKELEGLAPTGISVSVA